MTTLDESRAVAQRLREMQQFGYASDGEIEAADTIDTLIAEVERLTKVDVEPCCANWKAGTNCFADPKPNCPHLKVDVEPSVSVRWLAEMILSDCGCSTNNDRLVDRVANRIEAHNRANSIDPASACDPEIGHKVDQQ